MGSFKPTGTADWLQGGMATGLAHANNANNTGLGTWQNMATNIGNTASYDLPVASTALMNMLNGANGNPSLQANENWFTQNSLPEMSKNFGGYSNPLTQGAAQGMESVGGTANNIFQGGGWTPQYQQGFDQLSNFLKQGTPGLQTSANQANSLIGNAGANPFNQQLQQNALKSSNSGGMTSTLSSLLNPIGGIIQKGGNTAQSNALMGGASPFLQTGGQTNLSQGIADQGMNLFKQQALMNPAQAAGLARNQAATNFADQAQHMQANALARGGGPGATVANGMQNQGMADFADQASRGTSQAVTGALQNQQGLQLQQQGMGAQAAQGAGGLQNNMLGTAGQLAQGSGALSNSLLGNTMGLVPQVQNSATGNLNAYLNGGGMGSQNQLGMLGAGSNLANMLQQGQLGGINAMTGMMGNQNNYALGAGGLAQTASNNLFNNALGAGQLDNARFGTLSGAMNQGYGNQNQTMGNLSNIQSTQYNPLMGLAQQILGYGGQGLGAEAGMLGGGMGASGQAGMAGQQGWMSGATALLGLL